ncbi:MAG: STAS domain-containing protein [Planctomycetota bacterium]
MLSRLFRKDPNAKRSSMDAADLEALAAQVDPNDGLASFDRFGSTIVATLKARTLSGQEAAALVVALTDRITDADPPCHHVVLDLQNVDYMDSACIGVLVELLTRLQKAGGRVALVNAATNVECLFKLTRLDRLFPICRDVMRAIEAVERHAA